MEVAGETPYMRRTLWYVGCRLESGHALPTPQADAMNDKRGELLPYRRQCLFRWYRVRLWLAGPAVIIAGLLALAVASHPLIRGLAVIVLWGGITGRLLAALSAWLYFDP